MLPKLQTALVRRGAGVLYSTLILASGTALANTQATWFGYAKGGNVPGGGVANLQDTNMLTAGQMSGQAGFLVESFALQIFNTSTTKLGVIAADYHAILDQSIISWEYGQATIQIAPAVSVGAGGGIYGVAGTLNLSPPELNNGCGGVYSLRGHGVVLAPMANFTISWNFGAASGTPSVNIGARLLMIGSYDQAVVAG